MSPAEGAATEGDSGRDRSRADMRSRMLVWIRSSSATDGAADSIGVRPGRPPPALCLVQVSSTFYALFGCDQNKFRLNYYLIRKTKNLNRVELYKFII